jgi:hypothetical protein
VKRPASVKRSAHGHTVLLWLYLDTDRVQRRCTCEQWKSPKLLDTPENRQILTGLADAHLAGVADAA